MALTSPISELKTVGLVNIDYPNDLRETVEKAVASWTIFCQLAPDEKRVFTFVADKDGDGAGYELKEERGTRKDLKENFQVTLLQHDRLSRIANCGTFPFINDAQNLLNRLEPLIIEFARNIEDAYQLHGLVEEVQYSKPCWTLRYLHYFGNRQEGTEIAAPHADKCGFTLHLFESDAGLQYYSLNEHSWKAMPVEEKQTVIIPSAQLQFRSTGTLTALYHRVVATEKTAQMGRFSMVCFIPFLKTPLYNKELHGSVQTHAVGFNYNLPHKDFAKFFQLI